MSSRSERLWPVYWLSVFTVNLIVPLLFGWPTTEKSGRGGMLIGIFFCWLWAHCVGGKSHFLRFALLFGGAAVALSQLVPSLQILSGWMGMGVGSLLGQVSNIDKVTSEWGGFIVTMVTGGSLQIVSLAVGGIAYWIRTAYTRSRAGSHKPVEPQPAGVFDREMDA